MNSDSINRFLQEIFDKHSKREVEICYEKNGRYHNDLFAIGFDIPDGWHVLSLNKYLEAMQE